MAGTAQYVLEAFDVGGRVVHHHDAGHKNLLPLAAVPLRFLISRNYTPALPGLDKR